MGFISANFADAYGMLCEKKNSQGSEITRSFTDIDKPCFRREFLKSQICLLTHFCENKILKKISLLTVFK